MGEQDHRAWGRVGGLVARSRNDPRAMTAPARATWLQSFRDALPSDLSDEEREARARAAIRARMVRLGIESGKARRARRPSPANAEPSPQAA